MCAVLTIWVCWDCIWGFVDKGKSTIGGRTAFPVFRAIGGLVMLHWFWGISTFVWTRYRVNYIFLFDFNPNIVDSPIAIFNNAVDETLVFLVCMLLYYKVRRKRRRKGLISFRMFSRLCVSSRGYTTSQVYYRLVCTLSSWFCTRSSVSYFPLEREHQCGEPSPR